MPILNWLTRDEDVRAAARVPYRLLEEAPDLSAGERHGAMRL
jgi:adenine-specific DNA-methyltransferase